jgi:hypothetical protein
MRLLAVLFLTSAAAVSGCETLSISDLRWVRDGSSAADPSGDRAACLEEVASNHRPLVDGGMGTAPPIHRVLVAEQRVSHMAACMRARGWNLDPRDRRESAGQQIDRSRS